MSTEYNVIEKNLIIYLGGDLDHHNAEQIRKRTDALVDINRIKNIVFDFSKVSFMDSSGIGVVMGRYKKIYYDSGKVVVVGINNIIDRIFKMSALYKITYRCDDVENALLFLNSDIEC